MMKLALIAIILGSVGGCVVGDDGSNSDTDLLEAGGGGIGVKNGSLVRGTSKFRPHGLTLTGLAMSPAAAAANPGTVYSHSQKDIVQSFDASLARYSSWGVDTLRFQVSQDALDPQNAQHDPAYLPLIISTIQRVRAAGFIVILSMRESMPGQFPDPCGPDKLPCDVTHRAWRQLLDDPADLGHDRKILLEIYNEPLSGAQNTDAAWTQWRPPHQALLEEIRNLGAVNVLIADGVRSGKFLPIAGKYRLSDPNGRLAYGIHPYPLLVGNLSYYRSRDWQAAFGNFCDNGNACVATEWATGTDVACFDPTTNPNKVSSPAIAKAMFDYLHAHNIGSAVWPGDYPSAIVSDYQGTLSNWDNQATFTCSDTSQHRGMGAMMRAYYVSGSPP